jgi:type II secretory pathway pseudopilin PulG
VQDRKFQRGVTLVEVAIVLGIIGALIGGLMMGARLINTSRILSVYTQAQATSSALQTFIDTYRAVPGDMVDARTRLSNCGATAAANCNNGDGDRLLGPAGSNIYDAQTTAGTERENIWFWDHLAAAGLLPAVSVNAPTATPGWGETNPEMFRGGFTVRSMTGNTQDLAGDNLIGVYVLWRNTVTGAANTAANFVVSPADAVALDRKVDDGMPLSGNMRARGTNNGTAADGGAANPGCRSSSTAYAENNSDTDCYIYFQIRKSPGL